ncbi:MAG: copper transporter [Actinomycetota bacterium]|nr:copper transporter [Actinomycetota bacterium]
MIDFRYLLITIIGIFLSLGVGIVMGSGLIGGRVVRGLRGEARQVLSANDELRRQIIDLEARQDENDEFLSAIEPLLVDGQLIGDQLVVFDIEGSDAALFDAVEGVVEEADGEVASRIELRNRLALSEDGSRQELAALLESESTEAEELRVEFVDLLGNALGAAASGRNLGPRATSSQALEGLLQDINDAGFVTTEGFGDRLVPPGANFLIIGGSTETPGWPTEEVVRALAMALDGQGRRVLVSETSDSVWELVNAVRSDDEVAAEISTVDNAETIAGRIDVALALGRTSPTPALHLGTKDGAAPAPTPLQ